MDIVKSLIRYYIGDQQKLFEEAHVIPPKHIAPPPPKPPAGKKSVGGVGVKGSRGSTSFSAAGGAAGTSQDGTVTRAGIARETRSQSTMKVATRSKVKIETRGQAKSSDSHYQTKPECQIQTKTLAEHSNELAVREKGNSIHFGIGFLSLSSLSNPKLPHTVSHIRIHEQGLLAVIFPVTFVWFRCPLRR